MQASKVYFTDMRACPGNNLLQKLDRLIRTAGMQSIDFQDKFVAIKIHFGEPGNLSFLRPNFARVVADAVKDFGGKPFLTDCNTMYVGMRKNALDHLAAAEMNGFNSVTCGCPVIIADGLRGMDETIVPLTGTEYVKEAKIGRAIMDADVVLSLNHFKGHESTGFGGAIKNIGMGSGSRTGKMEQHCGGKPVVVSSLCRGCKRCASFCAQSALSYAADGKASIDQDRCVGCDRCLAACRFEAIQIVNDAAHEELCRKMAEYAKAVIQDRPSFHINIVNQVSPNCDCRSENDLAIIPDVGMFASFDPVALDQACVDACNKQPVIPGSQLDEMLHQHGASCDGHFTTSAPDTDWRATIDQAEKIGLGTRRYELITVR